MWRQIFFQLDSKLGYLCVSGLRLVLYRAVVASRFSDSPAAKLQWDFNLLESEKHSRLGPLYMLTWLTGISIAPA